MLTKTEIAAILVRDGSILRNEDLDRLEVELEVVGLVATETPDYGVLLQKPGHEGMSPFGRRNMYRSIAEDLRRSTDLFVLTSCTGHAGNITGVLVYGM